MFLSGFDLFGQVRETETETPKPETEIRKAKDNITKPGTRSAEVATPN